MSFIFLTALSCWLFFFFVERLDRAKFFCFRKGSQKYDMCQIFSCLYIVTNTLHSVIFLAYIR